MIPVVLADKPLDFDDKVKNPGLDAIAELVGERPQRPRPGPRRKPIAQTRDEIPPELFPPLWRDALPDMLERYHRICAYLAIYIEYATGAPSVDHMIPKSFAWDKVYEWSNYRLACSLANALKHERNNWLDPFEIGEGWFGLEFVAFQVVAGPAAPEGARRQIQVMAEKFLNQPEFCKARREYVVEYEAGNIDFSYLSRRAPFIACELRRQGRLLGGDD